MREPYRTADTVCSVARWVLPLGLLWVLLSEASGWLTGGLLVGGGAWFATWLKVPLQAVRWRVLPAFCVFFLHELFNGAIDVALRALLPGRSVSPGWVTYRLKAAAPAQHLWLSLLVGLVPGTLASHVENDVLHLHVLDTDRPWRPSLEQLEAHLHRLSGNPV